MSVIRDFASLFRSMDWKDWLGVLLVTSLVVGIVDAYTETEILPGIASIFGVVGELVANLVKSIGSGALSGLN